MTGRELLARALDEIGLSRTERRFYETVLQSKSPLVAEVVKLSGLLRPTAYQALKKLKGRGLVTTDLKRYGQRVSAMSPSRLIQLLSTKQRAVRKLEIKLKEHIQELHDQFQSSFTPPKVELWEGTEKYRELAEETLASHSKIIRYVGNLDDYLEVVGEDYDRKEYVPERVARGIRLRIISNETSYIEKIIPYDREELRERKIIPRSRLKIDSSIILFDETVVFLSKPAEQLALSIVSKSVSSLLKNLFDELWKKKV